MRKTALVLLAFVVGCEAPPQVTTRRAPLCDSSFSSRDALGPTTNPAANDEFGTSVAVDDPWLVVGAPGGEVVWVFEADINGNYHPYQPLRSVAPSADGFGALVASGNGRIAVASESSGGVVDVFRLVGDEWVFDSTVSGDPVDGPTTALAISGNTIAVGRGMAPGAGLGAVDLHDIASLGTIGRLDDDALVGFGTAIAAEGGSLFIGAPGDGAVAGAVVEFDDAGVSWALANTYADPAGDAGELLGSAVAVTADHVYAGTPSKDQVANDSGGVTIFSRTDQSVLGYVENQSAEAGVQFGARVAASGAFLAVTGPLSDELAVDAGAVSVFDTAGVTSFINTPNWIWAPDTDRIGLGLAFAGESVFVGIPGDDLDGVDTGSLGIIKADYDGDGTTDFAHTDRVHNPSGLGNSFVGKGGLSTLGDRVLVGSTYPAQEGEWSGAAWTFLRVADGWREEANLTPSDTTRNSNVGAAVLLVGQHALVGVPGATEGGFAEAGHVQVFTLQDAWTEDVAIANPDPQSGDWFGGAIDGDEQHVVIGDRHGDQAHVFTTGTWALEATIPDVGNAVDLEGDLLLAGKEYGPEGPGVARLYQETAPGSWTSVADLTPPEPVGGYGAAVALTRGAAFVYAPGATATDASDDPGVVHVFVESVDGWSYLRTLEAESPAPSTLFGHSLRANGDFLAVSSQGDSADQERAGAAYVFGRDVGGPDHWGLVRRVTEDPPTEWSLYGYTVGWDDDALLVGTPHSSGVVSSVGGYEHLASVMGMPPTAVDDEVTLPRGADSVEIAPLGNDFDPDGDELFVIVDGPPALGEVTYHGDGQLTYTAGSTFAGSDSFSYVVSDCQSTSPPATVTILGEAPTCGSNATCPDGDVCVGTTCFTACTTSDDCGNGESCFGDHCAVSACDGLECPADEICYAGGCFAACVDDTCVDGQCFDGRCADDACQNVVCASDEVCAGGACFASCAIDTDCESGRSCFDGRCATDACEAIQCAPGDVCVEGSCFPEAQCSADDECRPGQQCVEGVCTSPPREGCCRTTGNTDRDAPLLLVVAFGLALGWRRR